MTGPTDPLDHDARMLTALVQLRGALQGARLPLEAAGVAEQRASRQQMIDQLEDFVLPRQMSIEAPLLVVVGGSTGAGKSTLVNSLVGRRVTAAGLLRPTTRSPVLVHHPDDVAWFGQDRLLPDLARTDRTTDDPAALQLVACDELPAGLAILDAPDVDSVEEHNRALAAVLLAAADLWLFVTSAARYSDQVPWDYLKRAAERSTSVAIVLDRTPPDAVETVAAHLARMLASRGLKDSPLFTVDEAPLTEDGLLPPEQVADIRAWLTSIADDPEARALVVRQTLDGAIRTLSRQAHQVADAAAEQLRAAEHLRKIATTAYDEAAGRLAASSGDGSVVRGEVLARWQELIGSGDLLRGLDQRVGRLRERVVGAMKGGAQQTDRLMEAVGTGLTALVLDHAEAAAAAARSGWAATDAGRALVDGDHALGRASVDLRRRAETEVRGWQHEVMELVRAEGHERRTNAKFLTYGVHGLGMALMVATLRREVPARTGDAVDPGHTLLVAVFGEHKLRSLVDRAGGSLERRMTSLAALEQARYTAVLDGLDLAAGAPEQLRAASRRVDDRRFERSRPGVDTTP